MQVYIVYLGIFLCVNTIKEKFAKSYIEEIKIFISIYEYQKYIFLISVY